MALNRKLNPPCPDGEPSECVVCKSKYHWARNCPHSFEKTESCSSNKSEDNVGLEKGKSVQFSLLTAYADGVGLDEGEKLKKLVSETYGKALLDTGCSTTVCEEIWLKNFIDNLSTTDKLNIFEEPGSTSFTFGDGRSVKLDRRVVLPCRVGNTVGSMRRDVVASNIPLLLSRVAMKNGEDDYSF